MATYKEAYAAALEYYKGDDLPAKTFIDKYALRDKDGIFLETTPPEMDARLAKELYRIESKYPNPSSYGEIEDALSGCRYFYPQGSVMYGAGNDHTLVSTSNCFVVDSPEDTMSSIFNTGKNLANIMKRRGGVGVDISKLRPYDAPVNNAARTSTGAWSFADFYSYICRMIGQFGRRGALMVTMDVRHPDIFKFATMKQDLSKVTGANISIKINDAFMSAVRDDTEYTLQWPVDSDSPSIVKTIKARELWDAVIKAVHTSAEPGLLMWDTMLKMLPAQCYADVGFSHLSTNPCLSGDTLIATADGRNAVSIKQLAEEGKDVPVYSVNRETGIISIKQGRNPRITGHLQKLVRVHLDDGSYYDVTPNHGFILWDGTSKQAHDLEAGDSLSRFKKWQESPVPGKNKYWRVHTDSREYSKGRVAEHKLISQYNEPSAWKNRPVIEKENGWLKGGLVVHHKDYDSLNNSPENLEIMTFREHTAFHAQHDTQGEKNGRFSGVTNEEIQQGALELSKKLSRRFSTKEWASFAKEKGMPQAFSSYRKENIGDVPALGRWAATELGLEHGDCDPRTVRTLQRMRIQGYGAGIIGNLVFVKKTCEGCSVSFSVLHGSREAAYCSVPCALHVRNSNAELQKIRTKKSLATHKAKLKDIKVKQAGVYSKLKFQLGRKPLCKEWEEGCKEEGLSFRLYTKFGYSGYKEVVEAGENYNHKVVRVEQLPGQHTVYNITVDDNHTYVITKWDGEETLSGVSTLNCGELILGSGGACRLLAMNITGFVENKFTSSASFNLKLFYKKARLAQRMMDNIVDLEIEKVRKIIESVDEPSEKKLWEEIYKRAYDGRRTGLGSFGLADALAQLGLRYDSDEALEIVDAIYTVLRDASYEESVNMAKERGAFPVWNWDKEKNNLFIKSLPKKIYNAAAKYGRRNISNLTNAPTGSLAIIAGNVSSGIEPVFRNSYTRRKKINHADENSRVDFIDHLGDKWQEFNVFHKNAADWVLLNDSSWDGTSIPKLPGFFVSSEEINWENRVRLQGVIQSKIDHSISSTINLPSDVSVETVSNLYIKAWEMGLKGVTVYVDGSRTGVLVSNKEKKDDKGRPTQVVRTQAPKRPRVVPCDVYHGRVQGDLWTIIIGLLEDEPYEIFGGPSAEVGLPKSVKNGYLEKTQVTKDKNRYDLKYSSGGEEVCIEDIGNRFENKAYGTLTRVLSLSLRHGAPVQHLVEQLGKDHSEELNSLSSVLRRALKKYIKDGTAVAGTKKGCEKCGSSNLRYQEGCPVCLDCGFTKCK